METNEAATAFAALGLPARLEIFSMLLNSSEEGLTPGEITARTGTQPSSVSSQLKLLAQARLIVQDRKGRQILYRANPSVLAELTRMLSR